MDVEAYKQQLKSLLPPGKAFPQDVETILDELLWAMAEEFSRMDTRASDLLKESYPRTSDETLTDWERITGLPAPCIISSQTKNERRDAVHAKLGSLGDQSRRFFIGLAQDIGFETSIKEFRTMKCNDPCNHTVYSKAWAHVWEMNAPEETIKTMTCSGACDEPLRKWGNELLECIISQFKPAHTQIIHTYGS